MSYSELITDECIFSSLRNECNKIFDTSLRLPKHVFRHKFDKYYVFPYSLILGKDFATVLANISDIYIDAAVNYMTIAPHPVDYFYKNCGFYGLATFAPEKLTDRYAKVMSRDGAADSFQVRGGDICVFWGTSQKWGIYCDRISWELCVMGLLDDLNAKTISALNNMGAKTIEGYILAEYRDNPEKASDFLKEFFVNYPTEKIAR